MLIKKIKNLKLSTTPEQLKNEWNELKSVKNRLLQNSDWIFLPDNNLEEHIIALWIEWRKNVRRSIEFIDIKKALHYLQDLQNNPPPIKYKNTDYVSVEAYKHDLSIMLRKIVKKSIDGIYDGMDSREIIMERFEEALRFMEGHTEDNFLIELEAEHSNSSPADVAERFIEDRKNYFLKLMTIEKVKNRYIKRIDSVDNIQDCDKIRDDLLILGSKKWI